MNKVNNNSGFTLLEILIVVAIAGILVGISIGVFLSVRQTERLAPETEKIASTLRLAQNRALASQNALTHGVRFEDDTSGANQDKYIIFEGADFASATNTEEFLLDNTVEFLNINLNGGGIDVIFNRISGFTTESGFVELASTRDTSVSQVICISENGSINILSTTQTSADCENADVEYTEGTTDNNIGTFQFPVSAQGDMAQSFTTAADAVSVRRADLLLKWDNNTSSPANKLYVEIRQTSTVGNIVGQSMLVEGDSLPTAGLGWVQFTFPVPVDLSASTQYFIRLRSLPDATNSFSQSLDTIHWGFENATQNPPAYDGGDAWCNVGELSPTNQGTKQCDSASSDNFDFSFRIFSQEAYPQTDSRHIEANLGFSLPDQTNLTLSFDGSGCSTPVTESITIADFMNEDNTEFDWEEEITVCGETQTMRVHSLYIDDNDTILSIHRDAELNTLNSLPLLIEIDGLDVVNYDSSGSASKGADVENITQR